MEEALKKTHSLLESIIENQEDIIVYSIDKNYRYLYFNKAHSDRMKSVYNSHIQLGKSILDYITSNADSNIAKENYDRTLEGESHSNTSEFEDLKIAYFENFFNPIIVNNEIVGISCLSKNITKSKQIEIKLKKVSENLATILKAIPDLIFEVGLDGRIYNYHSNRNDLLAAPPEMFLGKIFQEILPPEPSSICMDAILEANKKGWSGGQQYSLDLETGKHWFELSVSAINESNNNDRRFILLARDITTRKKAEDSLRESEERMRNLLDSTDGIVWEADATTFNFTFVSKQAERLLGFPIEEWYANDFWKNHLHPEDRDKTIEYCASLTKQMKSHDFTYRFITNTGQVVWLRDIVNVVIQEGKPRWLRGVMFDITKQKKTEEALRESEEKYRSLVENSPDAVVIYIEDKIVFVNEEGIRMIGAANKEEVIGKPVLQFIHPDSIESVIQRMIDVLRDSNASDIVEEKFIDLYGKPIDVELKAIPTVYEQKDAVQVIIHDITERKNTQEKIKQLSQAVEQSPVSIIITNIEGNIEYANPKFSETTGYSFDEIVGQNPRILKSGHTTPEDYKKLWLTLSKGEEWHGEFHNVTKNGDCYWESATISPILNAQGKITHYIAIKEDITDRKKAEEELIQAKEKAEESDRLKLAFLANMSHEIRTPMNGILGFTELLKSPNLSSEEQQEYVGIIEKSGVRMLNIINDIISISKVESGQIEIALSETNINDQIEYLHTFFKPEATHKGIQLITKNALPTEEAVINTDCEKVYAILTNLVKNAIKFTDTGSIEFGYVKKGNYLEFFVKDTGLGISNSQQKIIFERFRQANDTISRSHEGSGLGLAISKAYVEMLGGKIWVESNERKGSCFYFTLPFDSELKSKDKIISPKKVEEINTENKINDLKVLIVEDDPISKLLITVAVKPYSKEILKVSTGLEAIEACRNNQDIDLVMMDINMPEMGGYEATQKIRQFNKDLIIIAQTANGMQSDRDEAITAGCTDYISKPVNIAALSELIQKHFKK